MCPETKDSDPNLIQVEGSLPILNKDPLNNCNLVNLLLDSRYNEYEPVQIDAQEKSGYTPLHLAVRYSKKEVAALLLGRDANPNLPNMLGFTPLHICLSVNNLNFMRIFFKIYSVKYQLVQVNAQDKSGETSLHSALRFGNDRTVEFLLRAGANPNLANEEGLTTLHFICMRDNDDDLIEVFFKVNDNIQQTVQVKRRSNDHDIIR
uniref:Uncharacterized protein n=2 Tax=Trichogramma kaykai TaxID=54128 RepID=A0ABD2X337_9HYME